MADHNELGKIGESIAAKHLAEKGFEIIDTNWRHQKQELDIVAVKDGKLIFVEVKTRGSAFFDTPSSAIPMKKQRFLVRAADAYIKENDHTMEGRFDVIFIIHNSIYTKINHIEDAFYATL